MPVATIGNATCHYQDVGEGHPILFGHSYLWSSEMWEPQIDELSKHFRCIVVDLWDHGKSGHLNEDTKTLEDISEDYFALMQHLGLDEFSVVGLSVGGMWGTYLALNHKNAVKSLVIMDTYLGSEPAVSQEQYNLMLDMIYNAKKFPEPLIEEITPLFFSSNTIEYKKEIVEAFKDSLRNYDPEMIPGLTRLGKIIFSRENLLPRFNELTMPSLVFVGEDDLPRPVSESKEMADLLPNAKLHVIEKAGHISNLERPDLINPILYDFFKSHELVKSY